MKLLEQYIIKTVASATALVTCVLAGLQIFILFVNQSSDIGKGHFLLWQVTTFVFLQLPYQIYLFFPLTSLLGCLIGLGILANHHELIVMRAAGISIAQITITVLKAAVIIIILITIIGETLAPKLSYLGNKQKMQALSGGQALQTPQGTWLRYDNNFIVIGSMKDHRLQEVYQFNFDNQNYLNFARKIATITMQDGRWQANEIVETRIHANSTTTHKIAHMVWDLPVSLNILNVANRQPDEMTLQQLRQYLHSEAHSHQNVISHRLAYWQRLVQPLTTIVMTILAIPFIFGPLRSSTMGAKILTGALIGFSFHIFNRFFGPISQVLQWSPTIAAIGPTCFFALLGCIFMRKAK